MSDDDDYYDESDEEIFWIIEPEPEIADELAENPTADPVFFDEDYFDMEIQEYYSDWDEMVDDYYDADPTAERLQSVIAEWPKKNPINAPALPSKRQTQQHTKSESCSKKIPSNGPQINKASFHGVVWRTPSDERSLNELYEPGDGEKVALLKNWREVFRTSHPAIDRTRSRKGASLKPNEDTGHGRARAVDEALHNAGSRDFSVDSDYVVVDRLMDGEINTALSKACSPPPVHRSRVIESAVDLPVNSKMMEHEYPFDTHESYSETLELEARSPVGSPKAKPSLGGSRKRKASVSLDVEVAVDRTGPDTSLGSRSKRVAMKKTEEATGNTTASTEPVRRSVRSRSKK
ncbi:hypothetical protein EYZ11_010280 [Aspergillus tanneri]|uniref:Uncharacterized protein n=1 Tax=Aspergillus tanneri TaxID=1220188 RepID=A0A4S3J5P9_9EURO|nr:uncharacterized protein ATNIH1004_005787 [Aspergillus tanneri]KAA8647104.1 hypothetical protein ATNIH1004_005787 [Aspergillus tanneri]THC90253.1 hypothetical protein EYZ11_010280 [Aspergillus tanneri]